MTHTRKLVALLTSLFVVLGLWSGAPSVRGASGFVDVPAGSLFAVEIGWADAAGIVSGWSRPDGLREFRPLASVSRDAMAAFLYRLAGSPGFVVPSVSPFVDVSPSMEHYKEMAWAFERGISTGWLRSDGLREFRPAAPIARDAMAAFLYRFAGSPGFVAPSVSQFWDVRPSAMFYEEISWLAGRGVTTGWPGVFGCPDYRPGLPVARDAMAAFLYRMVHGGVPVPANTCGDARFGVDWETLPTTQRVVALTFDGGASNTAVDRILATLSAKGVPATFFVTGDFARRYPSSVRAMDAAGHPVGNHSVTHPYFTQLTADQMRAELRGADSSIGALTGETSKPLFRFPYGDRNATTISVVNAEGYVPFRWTVDSLGWQGTSGGRSAASVCERVLGTATPGQIVLMHVGAHPTDGSTLDADALGCIVDGLRARGYGFVNLRAFVR